MIVQSMSNKEIIKELLSDIEIVKRKADYLLEDIRRILIKTKTFPFLKIYDYVIVSEPA